MFFRSEVRATDTSHITFVTHLENLWEKTSETLIPSANCVGADGKEGHRLDNRLFVLFLFVKQLEFIERVDKIKPISSKFTDSIVLKLRYQSEFFNAMFWFVTIIWIFALYVECELGANSE
jgi:hypothetical protein